MRRFQKKLTWLLLITFSLHTISPPVVYAEHFFGRMTRMFKETAYHGTPPATCQDGCVEQLAENIDWLEHHIDRYGSIVAKQPDIWGEARLTKHRDEYERVLFKELEKFEFKLNAAIAQTDSSLLTQSLALSNAVSEGAVPETAITKELTTVKLDTLKATLETADKTTELFGDVIKEGNSRINIEPTIYLDQLSRYVQHLHELRRINEGDDTSDSPGYALNLVRLPVSMLPGKLTRTGFGAEITITATPALSDDLLPTTFRNLVINDLVDQLRLPLVRTVENVELMKSREDIKQAIEKFGILKSSFLEWNFFDSDKDRQEVTTLVTSVLNDKIVRDAIMDVIADIEAGQQAEVFEPITTALSDHNLDTRISEQYGPKILATPEYAVDQFADFIHKLRRFDVVDDPLDLQGAKIALRNAIISIGQQHAYVMGVYEKLPDTQGAQPCDQDLIDYAKTFSAYNNGKTADVSMLRHVYDKFEGLYSAFTQVMGELENEADPIKLKLYAKLRTGISTQISGTTSRARRARHPLPPSQVVDVYGSELFITLAEFFCPIYSGRQVRWAGKPRCTSTEKVDESRVNLLDAQKWLRAELASAHELLSQSQHLHLWYQLANPQSGLATAIRKGHLYRRKSAQQSDFEFPISPAYEIIETPESDQELGIAVPVNGSVEEYRNYFFKHLHLTHFSDSKNRGNLVLIQLAWAIVIESALLNQRLNEDIQKTALSKGYHSGGVAEHDLTFFLPEAAAKSDSGLSEHFFTATKAFQEYVKCRWPIHVFAIDPREQDQNVADVSARKREMQFALALGFVNGKIGANSLTQFSRNMETQVETISLNRTIVGFSHSNDTFGWRFMPRVQPLHVPGTFGAIKQTLCGVSRDDDLKHRQLEPGMRECVAIVLMPSFVPYADFDIRTNWFRLTNPKNTALTMKDSVHLSRAITSMRNSRAQCSKCIHLYREGEVQRMMKRVDQLDHELPMQSMRALVPYENTLGGFGMFSTGVTDLSPELIGWHGAPGIVVAGSTNSFTCGCSASCAKSDASDANIAKHVETHHQSALPREICGGAGTTMFLVGDNFSVHDSKVIAGGVCIPHVQLISREIMQVTIPSCVNTVCIHENGKDNEYVAIYVSTPYGITNHLHVPAHIRRADRLTPPACGSKNCTEATQNTDTGAAEGSEIPQQPASGDETFPATELLPTLRIPDGQATWQLIPLPKVVPTYVMTSAMQPPSPPQLAGETDKAIKALNIATAKVEAVAKAQAAVLPTEFVVNVQSAEASLQSLRSESSRRANESGPITTQLKTKVGECFRNLRDKLPGY